MGVTRQQLPTEEETDLTAGVDQHIIGKRSAKLNDRKFGTSLYLLPKVDLKKKTKIAGDAKKYLDPPQVLYEKGHRVEILTQEEGFSDSWYVATVIDPPLPSSQRKISAAIADSNKYYVEYETIDDDKDTSCSLKEFVDAGLIRPIPPITCVDYFSAGDTVDAFYYDGWWVGVITKDLSKSRFKVKLEAPPVEQEFHFSELRIHLDWVNDQWLKRPNQAKEKEISGILVTYVKRRGRPPKAHKSSKIDNESSVGVRTAEGTVEKDCATEDVASVLIGLSDRTKSLHDSCESGDKCTSSVGTAKGTKGKNYGTEDIASILSLIGMSRDERTSEDNIICHSPPKESQTFISVQKGQGNVSAALNIKKSTENGFSKQKGTFPELLEPRGRMEVPIESGERPTCVVSCDMLGKRYLGEREESSVDSSTKSPYSIFYGVSPEETEVDAVATYSTPEIDLDVNQTLPFEKTITLWDNIESMEVFRIFPQNPHFHTLENSNEDCREGLALGQMVTFSRIVKRISETQHDMSKGSIEKCLEDLVVLEDNGFDMRIFRDRLNELIFEKDKQDAIENDLKVQKVKSRKRKQRPTRMLSRLMRG